MKSSRIESTPHLEPRFNDISLFTGEPSGKVMRLKISTVNNFLVKQPIIKGISKAKEDTLVLLLLFFGELYKQYLYNRTLTLLNLCSDEYTPIY